MDKDEKLLAFLDNLGQDADVDFAKQVLEAHSWDLEAALNMITGGDAAAASAPGTTPASTDYVDDEGYRAPMRTGYRDTLLGPDPEEMVWEQAAMHGAAGGTEVDQGAADSGERRHRSTSGQGHRSEGVREAMRASRQEYQQQADQHEQGAIANALQASYADYNAAEQRRLQQGFQEDSEEQKLIAQAVEASFKEQNGADAQYRAQLENAISASAGRPQDATPVASSGRASPTGVLHSGSGRSTASAAPRFPLNAAARELRGAGAAAAAGGRMPDRAYPVSTPSASSATTRQRPSSGHGEGLLPRQPAAAIASVPRQRLSRGSSGGTGTGEVPAALSVNGRLTGTQRASGSGRSFDNNSPSSRGSNGRSVGEPLASRHATGSSCVPASSTATSAAARANLRDPATAAGPNTALGAAVRGQEQRPHAPGHPLPTAPRPPSSGSSRLGTPPATSVRHAEDQDYVPKVARDPRPALQPLAAARVPGAAPGQDAVLHGVRAAAEADRRRYPPEDLKRETREADLRRREVAREAEEQRQQREAETQERSRQSHAERRRDADAAAERQRRADAAAVAEASVVVEAERRRRREETDQQRRRDEAEQQRRNEEEQARQKREEAERLRSSEAEAAAAAVEAERKRREDIEFERTQREAAEVETRRREAREAEELAKERREAEERTREAERNAQPEEKQKESSELVNTLVAMRRRYKEDPEGLATCLKTLGTYIRNLANSPQEAKYQQINTENNAFQKRVAVYEGSTAVLTACGFTKSGTSLISDAEFLRTKGPRLFDAVAKIDVLVGQLQR